MDWNAETLEAMNSTQPPVGGASPTPAVEAPVEAPKTTQSQVMQFAKEMTADVEIRTPGSSAPAAPRQRPPDIDVFMGAPAAAKAPASAPVRAAASPQAAPPADALVASAPASAPAPEVAPAPAPASVAATPAPAPAAVSVAPPTAAPVPAPSARRPSASAHQPSGRSAPAAAPAPGATSGGCAISESQDAGKLNWDVFLPHGGGVVVSMTPRRTTFFMGSERTLAPHVSWRSADAIATEDVRAFARTLLAAADQADALAAITVEANAQA
ncbi:MAG: hypothetical protein H0V44_08360 [Planctomycetes bacterium]|nr:hypothetical protein [Planctomycetota bacterium]